MRHFFNISSTIAATMAVASVICACAASTPADADSAPFGLKDAAEGKFLVGTALNTPQIVGTDTAAIAVVKRHFNSIVAENCMKSEVIHPEENVYNFSLADSLVAFGEANAMAIIGHTLIWHSQLAPWFPLDSVGNPVSAEVLKERMKNHIFTVMGRYKGKIKGWDVVNEAVLDDGSLRDSPFYNILGEEYIYLAFQWAHEADPDAELYLNDYSMDRPAKRDTYVRLINEIKKRGLRIDAIGMQSHVGIDYPNLEEYENTMEAYAATGVNVMITEWEMSALPTIHKSANISDRAEYDAKVNPYPEALPDSVSHEWNTRMNQFWQLYLKHSDYITRVTAWGVSDGDSWKNDFPVEGRTDYPLLFDRQYRPKPFIQDFIDDNKNIE